MFPVNRIYLAAHTQRFRPCQYYPFAHRQWGRSMEIFCWSIHMYIVQSSTIWCCLHIVIKFGTVIHGSQRRIFNSLDDPHELLCSASSRSSLCVFRDRSIMKCLKSWCLDFHKILCGYWWLQNVESKCLVWPVTFHAAAPWSQHFHLYCQLNTETMIWHAIRCFLLTLEKLCFTLSLLALSDMFKFVFQNVLNHQTQQLDV